MPEPDLTSRVASLTDPADQRAYDAAMHCNRCGFCTSFCPTYLATGDEALSPRGRNQAFRALAEGRLGEAADGKKSFDTCLLCGICTSVCFAQVPTAKIMSEARRKVHEARGVPAVLRFALWCLMPSPALLEPVLRLLYVGKRLGVSGLLNRLGVLRRIHPRLAAAEAMVEKAPGKFLRARLSGAPEDAEVVQFIACGPNFLLPEVGVATAKLVRMATEKSGGAGNVCCGLPGMSFGDTRAAREMARKNIPILEKFPRAAILVDDSSCAASIKEWPAWFADEPFWAVRAEAIKARTKDLLEWLAEKKIPMPAVNGTVTYHDACKARYGQGITREPRQILSGISGLDHKELPEADQCCGGGGTYSFMQPEISQAVGARKAGMVETTGAETVLSSSVSCLLQLRASLKKAGSRVRAFHIAEFLAKALDGRSYLK